MVTVKSFVDDKEDNNPDNDLYRKAIVDKESDCNDRNLTQESTIINKSCYEPKHASFVKDENICPEINKSGDMKKTKLVPPAVKPKPSKVLLSSKLPLSNISNMDLEKFNSLSIKDDKVLTKSVNPPKRCSSTLKEEITYQRNRLRSVENHLVRKDRYNQNENLLDSDENKEQNLVKEGKMLASKNYRFAKVGDIVRIYNTGKL